MQSRLEGIRLTVGEVTFRVRGKVKRQERYIEKTSLRDSLINIRSLSHEKHTRNNIKTLIDQIDQLDPTL